MTPEIETPTDNPTLSEIVVGLVKTQNDIAREIGVSPATLSKWLGGKQRPDPIPARRLAEVVGIPLERLYDAFDRGRAVAEIKRRNRSAKR